MKKFLVAILIAGLSFSACGAEESSGQDSGSATQESSQLKVDSPQGYEVTIEGINIIPDMEAKAVLDGLGEPASYFEAASCAFGDLDKVWTYAGYVIDTYQLEGVDYIYDVVFTDDTMETNEGIYLGKTADDVKNTYGEPDEEDDNKLVYKKGSMKLVFILEGDEVISIEYISGILDK